MAYALWMTAGRELEALAYARKWQQLKPDDEDAANLIKTIEEYIEEKSKTLLKAKRTKLKTLQNKPVQNDLFNYAKQEQDSKIQTVQSEINALEQGEFNYYVPPTYINRIKEWINR